MTVIIVTMFIIVMICIRVIVGIIAILVFYDCSSYCDSSYDCYSR